MRHKGEFSVRSLLDTYRSPIVSTSAFSWDLEAIVAARGAQIRGDFDRPVHLATSMRTCAPLATAYKNRLAPLRSLGVEIEKAPRVRGAGSPTEIALEAAELFGEHGVSVTADTIADIHGTLANHGIAIGYNDWELRPDARRIDLVHKVWPLEHVVWWPHTRQLMTLVDDRPGDNPSYRGGTLRPITHGDGRWVVYSSHELLPWQQDAAILPGALIWAAAAFALRDWAKGSATHGNAKVVGELPEGVELQAEDENGNVTLSEHAAAFLALLEDVASLDVPVGIKPNGAGLEYLINSSRAWEVWERLALHSEKAAARVYLGTDGTLGATGGAPGVDIAELFGVATTIVQGDVATISRGINTGVIEPWAAVNFGDSLLAPRRRYKLPDADAARIAEEERKESEDYIRREAAFVQAIKARRDAGLVVTQKWVDSLAKRMGVETASIGDGEGGDGPAEKSAPLQAVS